MNYLLASSKMVDDDEMRIEKMRTLNNCTKLEVHIESIGGVLFFIKPFGYCNRIILIIY